MGASGGQLSPIREARGGFPWRSKNLHWKLKDGKLYPGGVSATKGTGPAKPWISDIAFSLCLIIMRANTSQELSVCQAHS